MKDKNIERIEVEQLNEIKDDLKEVITNSKKLKGLKYADIRIRADDGFGLGAENSALLGVTRDFDCCYGIRVFTLDGSVGLAYSGGRIGAKDFNEGNVAVILQDSLGKAYDRARANGKFKNQRIKSYGDFGSPIIDTALAPAEVNADLVPADFSKDPRKANLEELCSRSIDLTKSMLKFDGMKKAELIINALMNKELFASTEGAFIDESYAKTEAIAVAMAQSGKETPETHYEVLGNMHGLEVLDGRNMFCQSLETFALSLAKDTSILSGVPMLEGRFEDVEVVTDGDYNSLWVHENVGHPSEADRCLGMETGYAGRSWFFRNANENMLGKAVASSLLNVCSRNDLDAYGRFKYDHEGVKGTKVYHIKNGIFTGFLNSRWSALVMSLIGVEGQVPDGSMRATNAYNVPYIRMKQTGIEGGDCNPAEIIAQVKDGFYLVGKRIPSMSESRENFNISARKTYRVRNGKIEMMYRGGSLTGDAEPYMKSIWAVGNDVGLYNIFNCGKAQPMQVMFLCNQAPTMGARGNVVGKVGKK